MELYLHVKHRTSGFQGFDYLVLEVDHVADHLPCLHGSKAIVDATQRTLQSERR
jgi:hypothetical protein